jgi:predicted AAA+ superfamily ATPase
MIKIVYGPKGFGKTKIMLDEVNKAGENAKGNVVFISDKRFNTVAINLNVRCLYTEEYKITSAQAFNGFVNGLLAGNSDIEYVFIDGLKRIIGDDLRGGKALFRSLRVLQKTYKGLNFVVSVSSTKEDLPTYISRYVK